MVSHLSVEPLVDEQTQYYLIRTNLRALDGYLTHIMIILQRLKNYHDINRYQFNTTYSVCITYPQRFPDKNTTFKNSNLQIALECFT